MSMWLKSLLFVMVHVKQNLINSELFIQNVWELKKK